MSTKPSTRFFVPPHAYRHGVHVPFLYEGHRVVECAYDGPLGRIVDLGRARTRCPRCGGILEHDMRAGS